MKNAIATSFFTTYLQYKIADVLSTDIQTKTVISVVIGAIAGVIDFFTGEYLWEESTFKIIPHIVFTAASAAALTYINSEEIESDFETADDYQNDMNCI